MVQSPDDTNTSDRPTPKVCHESRVRWPTMTVLCATARAAVLRDTLITPAVKHELEKIADEPERAAKGVCI
jgi:hypothetical protein